MDSELGELPRKAVLWATSACFGMGSRMWTMYCKEPCIAGLGSEDQAPVGMGLSGPNHRPGQSWLPHVALVLSPLHLPNPWDRQPDLFTYLMIVLYLFSL